MPTVTATCHTEGCGNAEHAIAVETEFVDHEGETRTVDAVVCGVCGQPIEDVK
jgi:hypothetical protein